MMDNFMIAVAQYEMRALLVPDTATNAMNLVLYNLATARQLGREYIIDQDPTAHHFHPIRDYPPAATRAALDLFQVVQSRTISDARAGLDIDDNVELKVDIVKAAFERNAAAWVAVGEINVSVASESSMALKNLRQARSLLLRSLE
jgi:hypothetical protein